MSAFSFSAPQFTENDEQLEKASLSEEEKTSITNDLYGTTTFVETEDMLATGPVSMERELLYIPAEEKGAYLEALARCPDLIASESNPIAFLRGLDYDAEAAARRIIEYWKMRKSLFAELAFLPMTKSGALRDDLDMLELGIVQLLPDDTKERGVFYYEKSRVPKSYSRPSVLRVFFYVLNIAMQNESTQKNGIVNISIISSRIHTFDRKLVIGAKAFFDECFPMKLRATHFCFVFRSSFFETTIIPVIRHMSGHKVRRRMIVHAGPDEHVLTSLNNYGLPSSSVPKCVGGDATIDGYHAWLRNQL